MYTYFVLFQTMYVNITSSHCLQEERGRLGEVCATVTFVCISVEIRMHTNLLTYTPPQVYSCM